MLLRTVGAGILMVQLFSMPGRDKAELSLKLCIAVRTPTEWSLERSSRNFATTW
jgi:hypothetical protein